ncbi:MAG: tRNA-dihydrouridine synthase family protein [Treponema sp.]|jgi:tRNA-dihydrouridine synthase|nr:tRNA-dihydrouridine synthase family protein [Treponema sp.]
MAEHILAPMAELSHRALRELIESFFDRPDTPRPEYYSEMISAAGLLSGGPFEKWYLDGGPRQERLVYQLLGSDPEKLAAAAGVLDTLPCLGIDINMGCAAPAITRTGAGVRLMEDIDKAGRIAAALRKATKKRLSVKMRLGSRPPPGSDDLPGFERLLTFCRRLENEGVEFIALHPRLAGEKFKRRARWDYVEALRKELSIPVAGNGDIGSAAGLADRAKAGPAMIGRLAVKEPWVFAAAPRQSTARLEETAFRFLDLLSLHQPPEFHLSRARRFFRYYCDNFTWAEYLRNKINREESLGGIGRVIHEYCRENPR